MKSLFLLLAFSTSSLFSSNSNAEFNKNEDFNPPCISVTLSCGESGCYQTTEGETTAHIIQNLLIIDELVCG